MTGIFSGSPIDQDDRRPILHDPFAMWGRVPGPLNLLMGDAGAGAVASRDAGDER